MYSWQMKTAWRQRRTKQNTVIFCLFQPIGFCISWNRFVEKKFASGGHTYVRQTKYCSWNCQKCKCSQDLLFLHLKSFWDHGVQIVGQFPVCCHKIHMRIRKDPEGCLDAYFKKTSLIAVAEFFWNKSSRMREMGFLKTEVKNKIFVMELVWKLVPPLETAIFIFVFHCSVVNFHFYLGSHAFICPYCVPAYVCWTAGLSPISTAKF